MGSEGGMSISAARRWRKEAAGFLRQEQGSGLTLVAFSMLTLAAASGLAFDAGRGYLIKAKLSQAVDAAALAGGRALAGRDSDRYRSQVTKYFKANFPDGYLGVAVADTDLDVRLRGDQIEVTASVEVPATLLRTISIRGFDVSASAAVDRTVRGLEVAMVLDNSGSMNGRKLRDLKAAAGTLVEALYDGGGSADNVYVSLVPFTARANVKGQGRVHPGKAPNKDFVCFDVRPGAHAVGDSNPVEMPFEHYSGPFNPKKNPKAYADKICPKTAVQPLTRDRALVEDAIADMKAKGCTRYDLGAAWGWRALSPKWQGFWQGVEVEQPFDYGAQGLDKAVIIMTDGENTPKDCALDLESKQETEAMFVEACDAMKNEGILVYTVTFQVEDEATNTIFESCASGSERAFKSPSGPELISAFAEIASDLSTLRLVQ